VNSALMTGSSDPDSISQATILVVDDTPANITLLSDVLRTEYRIRVATDGRRALALLRDPALRPDLVLLDVMMPDMDGYEVCRMLKADPATSKVPVIFVTAMAETEDEARGLAVGGVDYVTKPINPSIVRARVRTHLAASTHARQMERLIDQLRQRSDALAELNRTLETRVEAGVAEVSRLTRLKRFFSPSVVDLLLSNELDDPLRTRRRELSVVFVDQRGFTSFSETSDPEEVMGVLGEYHEAMGRSVVQYGGTVERFAGDGIMIFFNDPLPVDNPSLVAVRMALDMQERFASLARSWKRRGYELSIGIGIGQGYATIGAIGFEGRRDYGAIGPCCNMAARLCSEAKGGQILIAPRVYDSVVDHVATVAIGEMTLKGFQRPVAVHEVVAAKMSASTEA
jgi:adenylate cyclase